MKPLLLLLAAGVLVVAPRPAPGAALADPTCVFAGPVDVAGQQVVPYIDQCLPTA